MSTKKLPNLRKQWPYKGLLPSQAMLKGIKLDGKQAFGEEFVCEKGKVVSACAIATLYLGFGLKGRVEEDTSDIPYGGESRWRFVWPKNAANRSAVAKANAASRLLEIGYDGRTLTSKGYGEYEVTGVVDLNDDIRLTRGRIARMFKAIGL